MPRKTKLSRSINTFERDEMMSSLKGLLHQRTVLKNSITRFQLSLSEKKFSLIELECRKEFLDSYCAELFKCQSEIETLDEGDEERGNLEDLILEAKAAFKTMFANVNELQTDTTSKSYHTSRLPKLSLPKFRGQHSEFKNFISLFESIIDNDKTIPNIEKFNHLVSCLSGEALGTVKAFQMSEDNYPKALASLKRVYDNKCLIYFDTISKLLDLEPMSKPSASALRSLTDTVSAVHDSLLSLGDDKNIANGIIISLAMSKVDHATRSKWEEQLDYDNLPLWSDCESHLNKRFQHLTAEESSMTRSSPNNQSNKAHNYGTQNKKMLKSKSALVVSNSKPTTCVKCQSTNHYISACPAYQAMSVQQRFDFAKSNSMCINCLRKGHSVSMCKLSRCKVCNRSHHTLLHQYTVAVQSTANQNETPLVSHAMHSIGSTDQVILATAIVQVKTSSGIYMPAKALLDSGSQVNFMTEDLAQKIRVKRMKTCLKVLGIGKSDTMVKSKLRTSIKSRINNYEFDAGFWILPSIAACHPDTNLNTSNWCLPENITLADPNFATSQRIDLLLGAETFFDLLCVGQIKASSSHPTLQKTLLGWVISGKFKAQSNSASVAQSAVCQADNLSTINELLQKFWELEDVPKSKSSDALTAEQRMCEDHFAKHVKILPCGRLQVKLPFKNNRLALGSSYDTARKRFFQLEKRLLKDEQLRNMYIEFMNEYLSLGHMSQISNKVPDTEHYFIPHQCVLRPQSTTTKLRVVFNASSRTSTQLSLNDILCVGPTVQPDLYAILLRFRLHKYAITADITKMYRQFLVCNDDRKYQLIVWRKSPSDTLQICQLNTVTYGTSSAPFLATRCLKYLAETHASSHSIGSNVILHDFYVDDLLTGANDLETLQQIQNEVVDILSSANLVLAKWFSNHPSYFTEQGQENNVHFNNCNSTKTLGVQWNPQEDVFKISLDNKIDNAVATKRHILSVASSLFDPLGLLAPIIVVSKILLQELWLQKLDWDESIPMRLNTTWNDFKLNLNALSKITIPRFVHTDTNKFEVHGFADASIRAYGCCIYIRSIGPHGIKCSLLTAKSRVAPLKTKSLPRLELCAAHLLTKLWLSVSSLLTSCPYAVYFWSDSQIVLHWLKLHPSTMNTFVANRVAEIQEFSERATWCHVPSKENPADLVSRGCTVDELITSIWFSGPRFLLEESTDWQNLSKATPVKNELLELKKTAIVTVASHPTSSLIFNFIENFSNYNKLLRIFAYILRWPKKAKSKAVSYNSVPSSDELKHSFLKIIQVVQHTEFSNEIVKLSKREILSPGMQKLNPFLHEHESDFLCFKNIRVGGRLLNAPLTYDAKFPLLLSKSSNFVHTFLRHLHVRNHHAGPNALLALAREKIWIVNGREVCRKVVRNCIHCFKYKPTLSTQIMGNLPADRLRSVRPFLICGVDYFGPVYVTLKLRGRPPIKMYIAVFVCFTSKAVHFEIVSNLTSNNFICALKRFVGRRGLPERIYCDNATNFVGAQRQLQDLKDAFLSSRSAIADYATNEGFQFIFIPPRAPHFGGLWEAAVKSAKTLLLKSTGATLLTAEELETLLIEIEAILNSRPLAPLTSDPNDGEALTPGHLLIGGPLRSLPPQQFAEPQTTCLDKWRLLCCLKQHFWRAWSKHYLQELQLRSKWQKPHVNIAVGELVMVHDDNAPPMQWVLGRVSSVVHGQDGKVRVATVSTNSGILTRPIHKLAVLPLHG